MNGKLQEIIDKMMKELGFDHSEEEKQKYKNKKIIVVDDDTDEVVEVLREANNDTEEVNTE